MFLVHPQRLGLPRVPCSDSSFGKGCEEAEAGMCVGREGSRRLQEDPCAPGGREAVLPWPLECPLALLCSSGSETRTEFLGRLLKNHTSASQTGEALRIPRIHDFPDSQTLTFPTEWPKT